MAITRELLLDYLSSEETWKTYKSDDSGAGIESIPNFGYVYVYSQLGKASKKRIDDLAKLLVDETKALDENTVPDTYYENTLYLFKERLINEYVLEQVKKLKSDRKKLATIVTGLKDVINSDLLDSIQDYTEVK